MSTESVTGDGFVEVFDTNTSFVQRVPRDWLDDPRLGRFIQRTNAQLALDHDLPEPPSDATKADLVDYAKSAGVDVEGLRTKDDIRGALTPYFAVPADEADDEDQSDPTTPVTPAAGDNPTS